jgi:hypothetical protein
MASFYADVLARRFVAAADNLGDRLTSPNARLLTLYSNFNDIGVRSCNRGRFPGGGGSQGRQNVIQALDGGAHP